MKKKKSRDGMKVMLGVIASFVIGIFLSNLAIAAVPNPGHQCAQMGCDAGDDCELKLNKLGLGGYSATTGYPAGWEGGIHTGDLYSEGTVALDYIYFNSYFNRFGEVVFKGKLGIGTNDIQNLKADLEIHNSGLLIYTSCGSEKPVCNGPKKGALAVCGIWSENSACPTGMGLEICDGWNIPYKWVCIEPLDDAG